jgi:hypothetical protein
MAAYRVRALLREEFEGKEEEDFLRLPALKMQIRAEDLNATLALEYENRGTGRFERMFVALYATRKAWHSIRPFVAVDACHCSS